MSSLLGESRVIHNPGCKCMLPRHGWQHLAAHLFQKRVIAPGCIGNDVMQRLMHLAYVARSQTCRHRLDALSVDRQAESFWVGFPWGTADSMPGIFFKAIKISLKAFRLAGKLQLAKAHSINVLPNNLHRRAN